MSKERTRDRLVQATLRVLHQYGPQSLTTGRVAEEAGVAQPTFYVHFADMNDALAQAADCVRDVLLEHLRDARSGMSLENFREATRQIFRTVLDALLSDPPLTELFLRHRHDVESPLGQRFREIVKTSRENLVQDWRELGIDESILSQPELYADLIIGMIITSVEGLLDGRYTDREACVDALAQVTRATLGRAFQQAGYSLPPSTDDAPSSQTA